MQKRWTEKPQASHEVTQQIENDLKLSPLMARLLAQRNFTSADQIRSFFKADLSELYDPFLMKNMADAVRLLQKTIENKEKILVFGDYDVDGTCSVALTTTILKEYTEVLYYIPDRFSEGYGLSKQGIDFAKQNSCSLIIALDCGVKAVETIAYAKSLALEMIVCDHHEPGEILPDAIILDPKQKDCSYPFKELCGCGVGFKLLEAWLKTQNESCDFLYEQLDFVAVAIGADIVSLQDENRLLAKYGLDLLNKQKRAAWIALCKKAGRDFPLDLSKVVFTIAPRINAAGRLDSGQKAVDLMLAETFEQAEAIAKEIDDFNTERRKLDADTTFEALEMIKQDDLFSKRKSTVVFSPNWNKGVVGIVASRLIETHYRPTIVLTESNGKAVGSARSVEGFNLYDAISSCEEHLEQFGGHAHAAGLTLAIDKIPAFQNAFDQYVQENLGKNQEIEEIFYDQEIYFSDLFVFGESRTAFALPRLFSMQEHLEPFGPQNEKPHFLIKNVVASNYQLLKEEHLKLDVLDLRNDIKLPAIGFRMLDKEQYVAAGCQFDMIFTLASNTFREKTTLQLIVKDIRPSEN